MIPLLVSPNTLHVFTTAKAMKAFCKKNKYKSPKSLKNCAGMCGKRGKHILVFIRPDDNIPRLINTIAHEAVHAVVLMLKAMGVTGDDEETVAYAVGEMTENIWSAYQRAMKGK